MKNTEILKKEILKMFPEYGITTDNILNHVDESDLDQCAEAIVKKMSVMRSSTQLKDKEAMTFEEWCSINSYDEFDCGNFYKNQEVYSKKYVWQKYKDHINSL